LELKNLVLKTAGVATLMQSVLAPLAEIGFHRRAGEFRGHIFMSQMGVQDIVRTYRARPVRAGWFSETSSSAVQTL